MENRDIGESEEQGSPQISADKRYDRGSNRFIAIAMTSA